MRLGSARQSLFRRVLLSSALSVLILVLVSLVPMFFGSWNGEIKVGFHGFRLTFEKFSEYVGKGKLDRFYIGTTPRSMFKELLRFSGVSALLLIPPMLLSIGYGFYLPLWSRFRRVGVDTLVVLFSFVPIFLLAMVLQSLALQINTSTDTHVFDLAYLGGRSTPIILPFLTSLIPLLSLVTRVVRTDAQDQMDEEYVRAARGKGLGERMVIMRHVGAATIFRVEEMLPKVGGLGITVMFVVERVFNLPGLSSLLFNVAFGREFYRFPRIPKEIVQADGSVIVKMVYAGGIWVTTAQLQLVFFTSLAIAVIYGLSIVLSLAIVRIIRARIT